MGGRGTFANGRTVAYRYETVGTVNGTKVLQKKDKRESAGLPEEAHSSSAYILLNRNGEFKRYRKYAPDHTPLFDIDLHPEPKITGDRNNVYHIHFYRNGVRDLVGRRSTDEEYRLYQPILEEGRK